MPAPPIPNLPNPRADHDDSFFQGKNWLSASINRLIDAITPKCRENTRILSQGMDAPLPLVIRLRLRMHFLMCCYCKRYAAQLRYIRKASRAFPQYCGNVVTATLPDAVKERMKTLLRREAGER